MRGGFKRFMKYLRFYELVVTMNRNSFELQIDRLH